MSSLISKEKLNDTIDQLSRLIKDLDRSIEQARPDVNKPSINVTEYQKQYHHYIGLTVIREKLNMQVESLRLL